MTSRAYCAVYDFELMPYALGDVLTWNVQTAIRCQGLGRSRVDAYICMDERHPASVYQKNLVTAENHDLFFNELSGAFGTHPMPGNLFIFRRREEMLDALRAAYAPDATVGRAYVTFLRAVLEPMGIAVLDAWHPATRAAAAPSSGGGSWTCFCSVVTALSPLNSTCPVNSSKITTPSE